jgi:hypothetical protein
LFCEFFVTELGVQAPDVAERIQRVLQPYRRRMFDLSTFIKELKGRFAQWHNRRHGRYGVLWAIGLRAC